ncbi:serine protease, partial [Nocardioides sp.]|uniref:trypsin-like serine peptidase n=1 Tax=Nocardioides sp. TaxID=35761 RepID=UPI002735306F
SQQVGGDDGASVSSVAPLTDEAKAAGKRKFGAKATHDQALAAYWTADRMRAAKPVEETKAFKQAAKKYAAEQEKKIKAGKKPVTNDGPVRSVEGTESSVFGGPTTAAYNPNLPYYSPTAYTNGKVFFTRGGSSFVCSGSIINTEGKNSVWTAGHCVHGGQGSVWHSNWTFVPAFDDDLANPRPYGTWSARFLSSRTAWTNSSDFSQDIGVATMNTRNGWRIADYFGGQGITVNRGKNVYEYAFGYPAETPFDGGNLMRCQGSTSPEWDYWFSWSQTLKIGCDMTRGSSGGPWLYNYNGNWGYLNGVNSRIDRISGPTIMLSPYFDDDAWSLYNHTRYN